MTSLTGPTLRASLGAILLGGMVCTGLSGIVGMQTILYFRMFERDELLTKCRVGLIFVLDILHSSMVAAACYGYLVSHFGDNDSVGHVFWTVGMSIALTAVITVYVHLFFFIRLFKLSKRNYWFTMPIIVLAVTRVVAAFVSAVELVRLGSFEEFIKRFSWVFTLGLGLSAVVDVLITTGSCYYLRRHRGGTGRFNHILNAVTLYTVENGLLTSITTLVSLIFWLVKPNELIYLGLHFAISKLYANSFLASMNARKTLMTQSQSQSGSGHNMPVLFNNLRRQTVTADQLNLGIGTRVHVTVDKTTDYIPDETDVESPVLGPADRKAPSSVSEV